MNKSAVTGFILAALFALAPAMATADPAGEKNGVRLGILHTYLR